MALQATYFICFIKFIINYYNFSRTSSSTPFVPRSRRKLDLSKNSIETAGKNIGLSDNKHTDNVGSFADMELSREDQTVEISGRRLISIGSFLEQIKAVNNHNPVMGCTFGNMDLIKETRFGLRSVICMKCNMCNLECNVTTDCVGNGMDVNTASVAGSMAIGIGYSQLEELLSAMEVPALSSKTYLKYHDQVSDGWEASALQEMEVAAKEEIRHAVSEGNVSVDGIPVLTVVADGGWAKRSYRTNYTSLSGVVSSKLFIYSLFIYLFETLLHTVMIIVTL